MKSVMYYVVNMLMDFDLLHAMCTTVCVPFCIVMLKMHDKSSKGHIARVCKLGL